MLKISVIIPTYNRYRILQACLGALLDQTLSSSAYEIIVVNDGSTDQTQKMVEEISSKQDNVVYIEQDNLGPAAARNAAIKKSKGTYLLFTGDDIIASRDLLKVHLTSLESGSNLAVVGITYWDKEIPVTAFMEFLMRNGHQFDFRKLENRSYISWKFFYTSNVSLAKDWFSASLFDEDFLYPAWEDIEMGYRLYQRGLRLIFNSDAIASHRHYITENEFYRKSWQAGFSKTYFLLKLSRTKKIPLQIIKTRIILFIFHAFNWFIFRALKVLKLQGLIWEALICYHTNLGINDALSKLRIRLTPDIILLQKNKFMLK